MMVRSEVIHDVTEVLAGPDYYRPAHETIHDAITSLHDRREPVDMVTVAGELTRRGELERVGGAMFLHELVSGVDVPGRAPVYAAEVAGAAVRRRMIAACERGTQLLGSGEGETASVVEDVRQLVDEAARQVATEDGGTTVAAGLDATIDWLETPPVGADTPWADVNERTNGLLAGQMITVAGRPGGGKSLVCKDVGLFTALQGKPVHIASLEMSRNEYIARMLSSMAKVNLSNMLRRQMSDQEWGRVGEASQRLRALPIYIDDRESQSMAQIRAAARRTSRRFGKPLGMIGVDYVQLVRPAAVKGIPREQQVAQISRDTKLMAKEFQCPTLLLAQLNRGNTQRTDHTPLVSDLRESGSLEQDSDQVWLLHRPDQYGDEERLGEVDLIVGKNRNGPAPAVIPLAFQGHYARIVSMV